MDRISKEHRSWNMSRIRSRDTTPEIAVRSALHRLGYRFRLSHAGLPGRPDVVLKRYRTVVFVHGCFWHRHARCRFAYTPKTRVAFWLKKFADNARRDRKVRASLKARGWRAITIWECQTTDRERLVARLRRVAINRLTRPALAQEAARSGHAETPHCHRKALIHNLLN